MSNARKRTGDLGESIAADFLSKAGYRILARNFSCRYGEIDIVAEIQDCIVFVEVRTKKSLGYGTPEESITQAKKDKLILTAQTYLQQNEIEELNWRIDFIGVELTSNNQVSRIEHIPNAIA